MSNVLMAKNKFCFVDSSLPMPSVDSSDLPHWIQCNAMVKRWLTSSMEKEIQSSIKYCKTARDIWRDLEERFGKESAPRAYELRRSLTLLRQENMTVSAYYTKLKSLWDEID